MKIIINEDVLYCLSYFDHWDEDIDKEVLDSIVVEHTPAGSPYNIGENLRIQRLTVVDDELIHEYHNVTITYAHAIPHTWNVFYAFT